MAKQLYECAVCGHVGPKKTTTHPYRWLLFFLGLFTFPFGILIRLYMALSSGKPECRKCGSQRIRKKED